MKLCFVGVGRMGGALVRSLVSGGIAAGEDVTVVSRSRDKAEALRRELGVRIAESDAAGAAGADAVILGVKPKDALGAAAKLAPGLGEKLLISLATGVTISQFAAVCPASTRLARAMPNTPCLVRQGATGIAMGPSATEDDRALSLQMFRSVGLAVEVLEDQLDAVTALSGSGPAYVFLFIEALTDAGIRLGLPDATASQLAIQTVYGAGLLARESHDTPAQLREMVTSPAGTTAAALRVLQASGASLADLVAAAAFAARDRAIELRG